MGIKPNLVVSILSLLVYLCPAMTAAQVSSVTLSGKVVDKDKGEPLPYVHVVLNRARGHQFVEGTVTDEGGQFILNKIKPGNYQLMVSYMGFKSYSKAVFVGEQSSFLAIGTISLEEKVTELKGVTISGTRDAVGNKMKKKTFSLENNVSQLGGSVLDAMSNLPGVAVKDGKIVLRGSDKATILIDGKQNAITGFNGQSGLGDIPASQIDKIEIINNPSAQYGAEGSAGVVNIIMKKQKKNGFNGKAGFSLGLGSLWERRKNYPTVRPQYRRTPKANPSISVNYRKEKINLFAHFDNFYTKVLQNNQFTTRFNQKGADTKEQLMRNKETDYLNAKVGMDWYLSDHNTFTVTAALTKKLKTSKGDQAFFNFDITNRERLWKIHEDEVKTLGAASIHFEHDFQEPGHQLEFSADYSYTKINKDYDFVNILAHSRGKDAFEMLSDENVLNIYLDYTRPLKYGRLKTGLKVRYRYIPFDMDYQPGKNSIIDTTLGGTALYREWVPSAYADYDFETKKWEAELGIRLAYMKVDYGIPTTHPVYHSDGYHYLEPFLNGRLAYKLNAQNRVSISYNRRVDRPSEEDLRFFSKFENADVVSLGNPSLKPQFTHSFELGYKTNWQENYLYTALYYRLEKDVISDISTQVAGRNTVYSIAQNTGDADYKGIEIIWSQKIGAVYDFNLNPNFYLHKIDSFTVTNLYPKPVVYHGKRKTSTSFNIKLNNHFHLPHHIDMQLSGIYFAGDNTPQGKEKALFSLNFGIKKKIQKGKGELYLDADDLLNTMVKKKTVLGDGFRYIEEDYQETQVFRLGYDYQF